LEGNAPFKAVLEDCFVTVDITSLDNTNSIIAPSVVAVVKSPMT